MARVEIELNGRFYVLGCDDGQEVRLRELAAFVDSRMKALPQGKAVVSEIHRLVLTVLTLADQNFDLRADLAKARMKEPQGGALPPVQELDPALEERYAAAVEALAARVDSVASRLAGV